MSTKETLRQLARLFSPPTSSSSSSSESPFPDFTLPDSVNALLDEHLRSFAASLPPLSGTGGTGAAATSSSTGGNSSGPQSSSSSSEGERERARWREGLLEIWSAVEPLPGTESKRENLARVSAFLVLLHRLSADVGEDDDVALVSRRDIGSVWWSALLKRAMLGAPKDGHLHYSAAAAGGGGGGGGLQSKGSQTRGRKLDRKGRDAAAPATTDGATSTFTSTASPLYVSRKALAAAMNMIVWGMHASREHAANSDEWISPFGIAILHEYEQRALVRLQGYEDEGWGVRNLEECLIQWGEKAPKAFFVRVADSLTADSPPAALIPFVSLTLSYLSRHSTKAYYALSTPLLGNLITTALTTPSAAVVSLALRSLAIFVVTLPVVIGDYLFGIMAVYGRAVSWEMAHDQMAGESGDPVEGRGGEEEEEREEPPPDPMMLFTTLYGIYPCNFTAFLREPVPYLQEKGWKGATGDGRIDLASGIVRSKSEPYIRQHALSPALFSGDAASELSDTQRWSRLEAADVMAACDRNVISAVVLQQPDWRGAPPLSPTDADAPTPGGGASRGRTSSIPPGSFDPLMRDMPLDSASPTPKHVTPEQSPAPSRAASRARSPIGGGGAAGGGTSPFASPPSSRVSTPHMPPTTLYANFHALQSVGALNSPTSSASRSLPPRSQSRRRPADPHYSETTPHHGWLGFAPDSPAAAQVPPPAPSAASMSRRSSGVASLGTSLGLLSPDLIPFGRGSSPAPSHPPPSSSSHQAQALPPFTPNQVNAQLVKLETELVVLQGEVNFQNYLKQLHLQHMGTLHREKVLESGAEAERQSSFRTIRTLRAQLRATQNALDQVRSEQAATKANWTSHIADLRDKLAGLREQRMRWEHEERVLRAELDDWKDRCEKKSRELEQEGAEFLDLRNQASMDAAKLAKINEYEHRIKTLTKTLAVCDADLVKFVEQRKEMNLLVSEYKRSEYLRDAVEDESRKLKAALRTMDDELADLRRQATQSAPPRSAPGTPVPVPKDEISRMRAELSRLRDRNAELEERLADVLDDEEAERAATASAASKSKRASPIEETGVAL
ncbi:hypothetical protein B0A53_04515 [Rhodotorula sp. CCFEE 5036]|nr:hypothetical protein B0A53_04515 [Rhodotorula sp. CCFEE 5036]